MSDRNESVALHFQDAISDKVYHAQLFEADAGFEVAFQYGRRGSTLQEGKKTTAPTDYTSAKRIYDKLVREKLGKGYQVTGGGNPPPSLSTVGQPAGEPPCELLTELTQPQLAAFMVDNNYWLQEKRDGHRRLIRKRGAEIVGINRRGLQASLPPMLRSEVARLPWTSCLLDGEIEGDNYIAFDLLEKGDGDCRDCRFLRYDSRFELLRAAIDCVEASCLSAVVTAAGDADKLALFERLYRERREGVVFKLRSAPFAPGRNGQHYKFKFVKTLTAKVLRAVPNKSAVVVAVHVGSGGSAAGHPLNASWLEVASVSTIGRPVQVGDLVEVRYLYATRGNRLYQPVLIGVRTDVTEADCGFGQLQFKGGAESEAA